MTALQSFPVRNEVENLTDDLVSGPKNIFALRGASIPGRNDIKVGHLWVWTERTTWNPVGGFGDVYSTDICRNLVDPPLINDPFTGIPEPFRADYTVETAGPDGTLEVPADAVVWDAVNDAWAPVAAGTTAVSKVTFDYSRYFQSSWHHGPPITMADVIYPIAQGFEIAYDEAKIQIETALGITSRPLPGDLQGLPGHRRRRRSRSTSTTGTSSEGYIASYASPSGVGTPWELLAAMDDVVFEKRQAAYTDTVGRPLQRALAQPGDRERRPPGAALAAGVRPPQRHPGRRLRDRRRAAGHARRRPTPATTRCIAWFEQTNLLVIGNGPFQLTRYDPPAQFAQLDAFRADGYPFTAADFQLGTPPSLSIDPVPPPTLDLGDPISAPGPGQRPRHPRAPVHPGRPGRGHRGRHGRRRGRRRRPLHGQRRPERDRGALPGPLPALPARLERRDRPGRPATDRPGDRGVARVGRHAEPRLPCRGTRPEHDGYVVGTPTPCPACDRRGSARSVPYDDAFDCRAPAAVRCDVSTRQ